MNSFRVTGILGDESEYHSSLQHFLQTGGVESIQERSPHDEINVFEPNDDDDEEAVALRQADPNAEPTSGQRIQRSLTADYETSTSESESD